MESNIPVFCNDFRCRIDKAELSIELFQLIDCALDFNHLSTLSVV